MVDRDPILFRGWNAYMRHRQIMASSIVLKSSGWSDWNTSHAKLFGVFLWEYEGSKANRFCYNRLLRWHGYRRTQNYKLLKDLLKSSILLKAGRGTYFLEEKFLKMAERAITFMKQADHVCEEEPGNSVCSLK